VVVKNPHLAELGQFLRARRADVVPEDVGLPSRGVTQRRVAGLRREEVADAVAVSHDYYTRVEQGRLAPSQPVLAAICHLLGLTPEQRAYAEGLAERAARRTPPRRGSKPVRPQLQRLLDQLTDTPAFIAGKHLDFLAWNRLASALLADLDAMAPRDRNFVRMIFTNPRVQALYDDWEAVARVNVALLRRQAADNPTDPRLAALVGEMSVVSPQFRRWWADRHVSHADFGTKTIRRPDLGDLVVDWTRSPTRPTPTSSSSCGPQHPAAAPTTSSRSLHPGPRRRSSRVRQPRLLSRAGRRSRKNRPRGHGKYSRRRQPQDGGRSSRGGCARLLSWHEERHLPLLGAVGRGTAVSACHLATPSVSLVHVLTSAEVTEPLAVAVQGRLTGVEACRSDG
jgi:transcriptional regulator with XRE-family HTH domain